jgi:hypothetical protein
VDDRGEADSTPRAGIALMPKLPRSCWSTPGWKVPQEDREREAGGAAQGSLLLASPQQGVSSSRSWKPPAGLALSQTDLGSGERSHLGSPEVLQASVSTIRKLA